MSNLLIMHNAVYTVENKSNRVLDNAQRYAYSIDMNIDERLEKLAERHEALTQSVEMLTKDVQDLSGIVKDIALGTVRLLNAVEAHEQRIGDLEDNRPN